MKDKVDSSWLLYVKYSEFNSEWKGVRYTVCQHHIKGFFNLTALMDIGYVIVNAHYLYFYIKVTFSVIKYLLKIPLITQTI